jgi:tetratricopeptide (TPR) repeat protein
MLMIQIGTDGRLREEIVLKIARENAVGIDVNAYRKGLRAAFHTGGFVDYYNMSEYTDGIDTEMARLERLLEEGFAIETMHLCEYAFELADDALQNCDDSDGSFSDIAERLGSLHLDACMSVKPDPLELARRLFTFELKGSDLDFCSDATDGYKDVLGQEGLVEYRRLAEAEWTRATAKGSAPSRIIINIMESLARADGDVDALIAIKKRTLTSAYNYLDIAEICRKAGRADEALEWAEKGVHAFPKSTDNRLLDFLAEEYHRRKRYDEACRQYWAQFADRPDLHHYIKLLDYAKKIKRKQEARDEALAFIRTAIQHDKANRRGPWGSPADHSRLVEIFLWENDAEAAWREANLGGCSDQLWLKLAAAREKDHPDDAVPVYQRLVEPIISRMKNDAYEEATRMLKHIRDLMGGMEQHAEFAAYLADVKLRHKPKRNLMKLLAGV